MLPKSIRWRLPLSYAGIALLAALSLGVVLLTTLRSYYLQQELDYLTNNARGISLELARMVEAELPPAALQAQLKNFSFLAQSRVRLLDGNGQLWADSGEPKDQHQVIALSVEVEANSSEPMDVFTKAITGTGPGKVKVTGYAPFLYLEEPGFAVPTTGEPVTRTLIITRNGVGVEVFHWQIDQAPKPVVGWTETQKEVTIAIKRYADLTKTQEFTGMSSMIPLPKVPGSLPFPPDFIAAMPAIRTPYGIELNAEATLDGRRSDQVVEQPFYDSAGNLLGSVELSQGPAYGREILESVAWGWAVASGVAVLLAVGVGWLISRQLSQPLSALTEVTAHMARGNLSARANVARQDELGVLAYAFNEMAEQVEETVVTLRTFVANAAHELHTPLTALRTNLELATTDLDETGRLDFIDRADGQAKRLESLINGLLDLSRLEAGASRVPHVSLNLAALVKESSELYASRAEQADLSFSLALPSEAVMLAGDAGQLRQAIGNLLDNAIKFTPAGGAIKVKLEQVGPWLELWVEDTGIGIPAGDLPRVFSRFHRGRNAAAHPGSGLGLAIVKAIVEAHGGQVRAEQREPGACFVLCLPIKHP